MQTTALTILVALVVIEATISTVGVLVILRYALVNKRLPMVAGLFRALKGRSRRSASTR